MPRTLIFDRLHYAGEISEDLAAIYNCQELRNRSPFLSLGFHPQAHEMKVGFERLPVCSSFRQMYYFT